MTPEVTWRGCPNNTDSCSGKTCSDPENCFCEYHCSWRKCRLHEIPKNCHDEAKFKWVWYPEEHLWKIKGIIHRKCTYIYIV